MGLEGSRASRRGGYAVASHEDGLITRRDFFNAAVALPAMAIPCHEWLAAQERGRVNIADVKGAGKTDQRGINP